MKEAFYVLRHDVDAALVDEWNAFHAKQHVPLVMKSAGFLSAQRYRYVTPDGAPVEPPAFATVYRANGLGEIRAYLEGGEVGKMRAHQDTFIAGRKIAVSREALEENYSVDGSGKPVSNAAQLPSGRAAFCVRARVDLDAVAAWSAWYDREHMPAVAKSGFLRAGRYRVVEDGGAARFVILYEAPSMQVVTEFRAGPGPAFGKEHETAFGAKVAVERFCWTLAS